MPDTLRIVRDWIEAEWPDVPDMESTSEFDMGIHEGMHRCGGALKRSGILDALVGAHGGVVYTAEDVERAAEVLCDAERQQDMADGVEPDCLNTAWVDTCEAGREEWRVLVRAAISAAGGVVVDEVVEVACPSMSDALWVTDTRMLNDGDKLYIVRAMTDCDKEE